MGFGAYLKNSLWDYLLCVVASSSLCYVCLIAFLATYPYRDVPWMVVVGCAVVLCFLFAIAYNARTAIIGSVIFSAAAIACFGALWYLSPSANPFDDVVGNDTLLYLLVLLCAVMVFALSRKKVLAIVLLVGGLVLCCVIEYLYWDGRVIETLVFCISAACLYAYRNYQMKLLGSDSESVLFSFTTLAAGAIAVLAVALAVGVFVLVIAPLEPPSAIVKLLTQHVRLDEEHVVGTGNQVSVVDDRLFSWNVSGTTPDANKSEERNPDSGDVDENEDRGEEDQDTAGSSFNIDNTGVDLASAVRVRMPDWLPFALPLLALLLVALVIVARKLLRRRRCNRIRALPPADRVREFYLMFLRAFGKMKIPVPACQTLREYVASSSSDIGRFEGSMDNIAFAGLTETYSRTVYGEEAPSTEGLADFDRYYASFYRNARRFVGVLRYIPLFFRI